jgi:GNAT superfamily N-acetyltransferase
MASRFQLRFAVADDIPVLQHLINASVRGLQAHDYTPAQLEGALKDVYGVDSQLIEDGTYFAVEYQSSQGTEAHADTAIVGCGGWSKRKTLYGGDVWSGREDTLLDPAKDAARIRAFFVHPDRARHGIGSMILKACESAARTAGFRRLEMGATLTGVAFYRAKGYEALENLDVPLSSGLSLPVVRMSKRI